jgi:arsenate reductase
MTRPVVLYACIHNSGRSVAALYLTRALAGDLVDARSAGSEPGTGVDPVVAAVLAERGISTADHAPGLLTHDRVAGADVVITMGCGETCPVFPGKRYEDWQIGDPKGQGLETVRHLVDEVEARVRRLLHDLGVELLADRARTS